MPAPLEGEHLDATRSWMFDAPEGGGIVVVTYPFVLQTDGGPFVRGR
jgi:hypothetical protein